MGEQLREANGRFAPVLCPDPNCDGKSVADWDEAWVGGSRVPIIRCNGLTHIGDDGPMIACERKHLAAQPPSGDQP